MSQMTTTYVLMFVSLWASAVGCSRQPDRMNPPEIDASAAGSLAIQMFDTNNDGLRGAELDKCPGLKAAAIIVDPTKQGITADAITARINDWQNSKVGRMQVSCLVLHNGRPLVGADVKFVPEKFLGEFIKPAIGKTDEDGTAIPTVPTSTDPDDPPGVAPGFYRVEITKPGLNIPSQYNKETILGQEVAMDANGILGVRLDLKF